MRKEAVGFMEREFVAPFAFVAITIHSYRFTVLSEVCEAKFTGKSKLQSRMTRSRTVESGACASILLQELLRSA